MTATRKYSVRGYDHVYQITADRGICYYTTVDCLVWFTLLSILSIRYGIRILAVCIMLNHYHIELHAPSQAALSSFMRDLNALYTRLYNRRYGRSGPLFCERFKNSGKYKEQKIRENYLYICNNPVVKNAAPQAERYRWNFLAYLKTSAPFSEIDDAFISDDEERVKSIIRTRRTGGHPLDYSFFDGLYDRLDKEAKRRIIDYAIAQYNVIDRSAVLRMWESYEQLCEALHTVRGAEYDIDDDDTQEDYRHYYRMIQVANDLGYDLRKKRLESLPPAEKTKIAQACMKKAGVSRIELGKFLHIDR